MTVATLMEPATASLWAPVLPRIAHSSNFSCYVSRHVSCHVSCQQAPCQACCVHRNRHTVILSCALQQTPCQTCSAPCPAHRNSVWPGTCAAMLGSCNHLPDRHQYGTSTQTQRRVCRQVQYAQATFAPEADLVLASVDCNAASVCRWKNPAGRNTTWRARSMGWMAIQLA